MNIAIILSGGVGTRMGEACPKQYIKVADKPIINYCVKTFCNNPRIDKIVICLADEWRAFVEESLKDIVTTQSIIYSKPGRTRQFTIYNALEKLESIGIASDDVVIIHDAARPLVSQQLIDACLDENRVCDGVLPVIPMKDTIYMSHDGKNIDALLDRNTLFAGQAPESFIFGKYLQAHRDMPEERLEKINGSTEIAQIAGMNIHLIEGDSMNIKITTPEDLSTFATLIQEKSNNDNL